MGKRNKLRQAQQHKADLAVSAVLEAHAKRDARPRAAERYGDFNADYRGKVHPLRGYALRVPEDWQCRIKSRSDDRRFMDLVRFCFARYRVAAHLENTWLEDCTDDFRDRTTALAVVYGARPASLRPWYLVACQGGSLYKRYTSPYLSKLETHHFLTAPNEVTSSQRAFWYAVARAQTDCADAARRISETGLIQFSIASTYWKEVARFFARNPAPLHEMNDLIDYLGFAKAEDQNFSLKGRTLQTLRRRRDEWHRALRKSNTIGGGAWPGRDLPDADYTAGRDSRKAIWRFRQIKTGNELFREGQRMHHCVATYKGRCMSGEASIWSLTSEFPLGTFNRGVTLEVLRDGAIVQCRGFANRLPYGNEAAMVKLWARDNGLTWRALERR